MTNPPPPAGVQRYEPSDSWAGWMRESDDGPWVRHSDHTAALAAKEKELARVTEERDHWKANHDNQVAIKHAVLDRPDLGDRARSVLELAADRDRLAAENARLRDLLCKWHDGWRCGHGQDCTSACYDADRETCKLLGLDPLNWKTAAPQPETKGGGET